MVVGGGLFAAGWLIGRVQRTRRVKADVDVPMCPCGHGANFHDGPGGACQHHAVHNSRLRCECQRYLGPEVLSAAMWVQPTVLGEAPVVPGQREVSGDAG